MTKLGRCTLYKFKRVGSKIIRPFEIEIFLFFKIFQKNVCELKNLYSFAPLFKCSHHRMFELYRGVERSGSMKLRQPA